jgi:hypothetical protein
MEEHLHLALFKEDQIDSAAEAVARLHQLGIRDKEISIISGVPYSDKILGRPMSWTRISQVALSGAVVGFLVAMALNILTVIQYPLIVGGQPLFPIPTSIVVTFELTMLGLLISTFLGVFIETMSPSFGPKGYHPKISDGYIGVLYQCAAKLDDDSTAQLSGLGAEFPPKEEVIP